MKLLGSKVVAKKAFTLIELLVVIAIIAILVAILIPTIRGALIKGEKTKAQSEMTHIVAAIKGYYGEYGKMPVGTANVAGNSATSAVDRTFGQKGKPNTQDVVMNILRGVDTLNNPQGRVYLDVPKESMSGTDKDGNSYLDTEGFYLDPWGTPYVISMDSDYNGVTLFSSLDVPSAPSAALSATGITAAVISYGPDISNPKSFMTSWGMN